MSGVTGALLGVGMVVAELAAVAVLIVAMLNEKARIVVGIIAVIFLLALFAYGGYTGRLFG